MLKKVVIVALFALVGSFGFGGKVKAASIDVGGGCTINEAIQSINTANEVGSCTKTGNYGTQDTVNLPAGTISLTDDIELIDKTVIIQGEGSGQTTIVANGYNGFDTTYNDVALTLDITLQGFKIQDASPFGIAIGHAKDATLSDIIVNNSDNGARIVATHVLIENSKFTNNLSTDVVDDAFAGMSIKLEGLQTSDIPTAVINNSAFNGNSSPTSGGVSGLSIAAQDKVSGSETDVVTQNSVSLDGVTINNNLGGNDAGLFVSQDGGPTATVATSLLVDATTIAYNTVTVPVPFVVTPLQDAYLPVVAGVMLAGKLPEQQNFTNVTVAYNTVNNPAPDNRNSIAGFFASMAISGANMRITNVTVVGNSVNQPAVSTGFSSFAAIRTELDFSNFPSIEIIDVENGSSSENGLIAHNLRNGTLQNCTGVVDLSVNIGFSGTLDATPVDLGHNLSDDQSCTGYTYVPNLYDTIDHEVKDNGGPVPTIALHDNSPAVNAGGQVLGISTDARGVTRSGYYSVGAYQGTILASSTTNAVAAGTLAKTGIFVALASPVGLLLIGGALFTYYDYRRHKQPLLAVDSDASYSYFHHLKVVSLPLAKYRLSIGVDRQVGDRSDRVRRF